MQQWIEFRGEKGNCGPGFMSGIVGRMGPGLQQPPCSRVAERAAVPVQLRTLSRLKDCCPFPYAGRIACSRFSTPQLVKEDSKMRQTCPRCSLGMSVLEEHGSPPEPARSALTQGVHVWGVQMISLCFTSLMTHQLGHNLPPPPLLAALPLPCQAGPASFI